MINERRNWFFTVKLDPEYKQEVVSHVRASWDRIEPNYPMGYMFLEDNLKNYYSEEKRLSRAIQIFSVICLFIASLGLYGLTAYTIERKNKEIGVRKVLGANLSQLIWLINSKFIRLVLVASLLAIPVVYYLIGQWLDSFAYHISIGWSSFAIACLIMLLIVGLTVSSLALRAGSANPSIILRSE
jgi:putative ABC transport system permease protein